MGVRGWSAYVAIHADPTTSPPVSTRQLICTTTTTITITPYYRGEESGRKGAGLGGRLAGPKEGKRARREGGKNETRERKIPEVRRLPSSSRITRRLQARGAKNNTLRSSDIYRYSQDAPPCPKSTRTLGGQVPCAPMVRYPISLIRSNYVLAFFLYSSLSPGIPPPPWLFPERPSSHRGPPAGSPAASEEGRKGVKGG